MRWYCTWDFSTYRQIWSVQLAVWIVDTLPYCQDLKGDTSSLRSSVPVLWKLLLSVTRYQRDPVELNMSLPVTIKPAMESQQLCVSKASRFTVLGVRGRPSRSSRIDMCCFNNLWIPEGAFQDTLNLIVASSIGAANTQRVMGRGTSHSIWYLYHAPLITHRVMGIEESLLGRRCLTLPGRHERDALPRSHMYLKSVLEPQVVLPIPLCSCDRQC